LSTGGFAVTGCYGERGLPVVSPGERLTQVRETIKTLRDLDGADLHTPVVMAVRGPKSQALAAEVADIVTFVLPPNEAGASATELARGFRASRDVELALHVAVVGNTRAAFMVSPDIDPAAAHAVNSLAALPADPKAAAEEIQRRREEIGFSYFVFGANSADTLAPVVTELAGRSFARPQATHRDHVYRSKCSTTEPTPTRALLNYPENLSSHCSSTSVPYRSRPPRKSPVRCRPPSRGILRAGLIVPR
jgi:hypothetical protein